MILRPGLKDFQVVGLYVGKVVIGIGLLMTVPLLVSLYFQEWNATIDFAIGISACLLFGYFMEFLCYTRRDLTWTHGMVVAALAGLVAKVFAAIPYHLSGHFPSFLDATFDAISGMTTTGLFVLNDLDHISNALNMWRHLITFAGGQGIIVVALMFMIRGTSGAFKLYVGEAREERLLPNVIQTARAIGIISLTYLVIGTAVLWVLNVREGMSPERGFFHGLWLFMGAWSTAGFALQSLYLLYYHSLLLELATMVLFIIGSFNFALHYAVWRGDRREIYRNLEIISFSITVAITFTLVVIGLTQLNIYPDAMSLFRKGFYILISGHTGTGNQTIFARQFVNNWGPLAMLGVTMAMAIGGSACSTCGGIKGLRMGILFKSLSYELRRLISPESSVVVQKIHHIRDTILDNRMARAAMFITICFIFINYGLGTIVGVLYGYPLSEALFEAVSAGSTTGLSVGITSSSMPTLLKVVYMFQMWVGRLEFMAVFALFGFVFAAVRGE
ncbi:trk system potassium uptake protein [Candidatus Hakubella thermalkaliphila]|nr:trk system potassium uptake protein [Candidatus Hakubella thermalkaliphila]